MIFQQTFFVYFANATNTIWDRTNRQDYIAVKKNLQEYWYTVYSYEYGGIYLARQMSICDKK